MAIMERLIGVLKEALATIAGAMVALYYQRTRVLMLFTKSTTPSGLPLAIPTVTRSGGGRGCRDENHCTPAETGYEPSHYSPHHVESVSEPSSAVLVLVVIIIAAVYLKKRKP